VKLGKRAISPLIATIILIAICIAGGLLVYNIVFSTSSTLMAKGQISVESVDLVKDTDGNVIFSITVKNEGNKPATSISVTLDGEAAPYSLGALEPGESTSHVDSPSQTYTVGNKYNVVIEATFSDGSSFATTTSVMCRSG